ncbi:hypothetical protein [Volucribacter amazonae]|uniref:hypothetical protein n=1 Tax=Volucribacter amazonae TaxID=256731 RepID=UPI002441A45B|nr:hypothetical protein [Volucribacter amazonae]
MTQLAQFSDYQQVYLDETRIDTYLFRPMHLGQKVKAKVSGRKYQHLSLVVA